MNALQAADAKDVENRIITLLNANPKGLERPAVAKALKATATTSQVSIALGNLIESRQIEKVNGIYSVAMNDAPERAIPTEDGSSAVARTRIDRARIEREVASSARGAELADEPDEDEDGDEDEDDFGGGESDRSNDLLGRGEPPAVGGVTGTRSLHDVVSRHVSGPQPAPDEDFVVVPASVLIYPKSKPNNPLRIEVCSGRPRAVALNFPQNSGAPPFRFTIPEIEAIARAARELIEQHPESV